VSGAGRAPVSDDVRVVIQSRLLALLTALGVLGAALGRLRRGLAIEPSAY
jgi:hypothetical protein